MSHLGCSKSWSRLPLIAALLLGGACDRASTPSNVLPAISPVVLPRTEVHEILSRSNGNRYSIQVSLPRSYADRTERFGLLVLLDADYSFAVARNIVEHLSDRGSLRELVVVAVGYPINDYPRAYRLNRTRDYTPVYSSEGYSDGIQKVSGGAPAFQRFIADELLPWLERRYRLAPEDRGLVGHSYGALFGAWTLLTRPELFQRYILISPSLWYADGYVFNLEEQRKGNLGSLSARVIVAVGARESDRMLAGQKRFVQVLQERGYPGLRVTGRTFEDEDHDSVFPSALTWALREMWSARPVPQGATFPAQ